MLLWGMFHWQCDFQIKKAQVKLRRTQNADIEFALYLMHRYSYRTL